MARDIFVPLLRAGSDEAALDAAVALAAPQHGHVAALITVEHPLPIVTEFAYVPIEVDQRLIEEARRAAATLAESTRAHLAKQDVVSEVRITEDLMLWSEAVAAMHARHADLTVLGADRELGARFTNTFHSLLMQSGRPVLVMPKECTLAPPFRRIAVAWQPTREATRALHDALPLLAPDTRIDLVMIDPVRSATRHGDQPGADIATHLARLGYTVNVIEHPREGRSIGVCLLEYVRLSGSDLLVMGGYGHTRWREAVLGGTTRTVLQEMLWPVLFSH